jgi:hypothetical protein
MIDSNLWARSHVGLDEYLCRVLRGGRRGGTAARAGSGSWAGGRPGVERAGQVLVHLLAGGRAERGHLAAPVPGPTGDGSTVAGEVNVKAHKESDIVRVAGIGIDALIFMIGTTSGK